MNQYVNSSLAKLISRGVTICYLLIHILLMALFGVCRITPMLFFNVFSVLFYLTSFWLISREYFRFFVLGTYFEVLLHMSLATILTGWSNGFQITLVGISVLAFFAEYMGRTMQMRFIHALPLCFLGMLAYLLSYVVTARAPAPWPFPEGISFWMNIIWCVITFSISILCLQGFTLLTFHSEKLLSSQMMTDALTGLPNRYYLSLFGHTLTRRNGWVAMLDIDDFKTINDSYGHNTGDEVLRTISRLMRQNVPNSTACRWGGEEFLLFGSAEDLDAQRERLDSFRRSVAEHVFLFKDRPFHVTVTIGLAAYEPGTEMQDWISTADKKLYVGKRSGKNQVVI